MEGIFVKKLLIILIIFAILLISFSGVSATDSNNITVNPDENLLTADDATAESDRTDVELIAKEQYGIYGNDGTKLKVYALDKNGENVTGGTVLFADVFGKNYTAKMENGVASTKVYVGETGKFNITCKYIGTDVYSNADAILPLTVPVANTECTNIIATRYDDTVYFSGNMKSDYRSFPGYDDFEEVTQGIVTVYVDGEKLESCDVDVNGNYVYIWKTTRNLIGQTINFTGVFTNSQKHFNSSEFSKSFTFAPPKDTKIISHVTPIDNNKKLVSGNVVDENGNNVIGGTITVNGRYSVPVDTKGEFKFYITDKIPGKVNYEIGVMDWGSKADIRVNAPLMNGIEHTELTDRIIDLCTQGSPYVKFGNGNGKTVVMIVGTHGGELPSQAAGFTLINLLADYGDEINGTIYIFPVLFPESTANNTRIYNGTNLNTVADVNGTVSNHVVKFAISVNADGIGDFHNTRHDISDVGITSILCSENPTPESAKIAEFIVAETGYQLKKYKVAGVPYAGAIEDYANILGTPSVTCESLSNHRAIEYGTPEMSFNEMRAFLRYFGFDINEIIDITLNDSQDLLLTFESPYNYNPSSLNLSLNENTSGNDSDFDKIVASAGVKTLPAAGNPIAVMVLALFALLITYRKI